MENHEHLVGDHYPHSPGKSTPFRYEGWATFNITNQLINSMLGTFYSTNLDVPIQGAPVYRRREGQFIPPG